MSAAARRWAAILGAVLCLAAGADPGDRLSNGAQEARARSLFRETRCLVCQGESIDDSDAPLAGDLRRVIRQQISAGQNDGQVRAFLAARYGDFVLFRPRLTLTNALLWLGPFLVALGGVGWLVSRQRRSAVSEADLTPDEESRLKALAGEADTITPDLGSKNATRITER